MGVSTMEPREFFGARPAGARLLDVRTVVEFREVHAAGAVNVPLQELTAEKVRAVAGDGGPVYVICKSGKRAQQAAERCATAGLDAVVLAGGTDRWVEQGGPVEREAGVISLERQVRLAVGVSVLTFALLAVFVHPAFAWGCAFFGAGLTFAGATGWCGLGLVLAAMPWNRGSAAACAR